MRSCSCPRFSSSPRSLRNASGREFPSKKLTCSDRARNSIAPRDYRPLVPPTRVAKVSCPVGRAKARWRTQKREMVMTIDSPFPTRRTLLATSAAAIAAGLLPNAHAAEDNAIRPFRVNIPEEALVDLRRRIQATRWPDKETVADGSQGAQLGQFQELVRYWGKDYDWRKLEAKLNAL